MRLYELQKAGLEGQLERQLQGVSDGINQTENQPDAPPQGIQPGEEPDLDEPGTKPVDSGMMASMKGLPYVSQYNHTEDEKLNPVTIMTMGLDELNNLRNMVRTKINMVQIKDEPGLYDSPDMKFYQDLMSFVERVVAYRKQHDETDSPARTSPPVNKPAPSQNQQSQPAQPPAPRQS